VVIVLFTTARAMPTKKRHSRSQALATTSMWRQERDQGVETIFDGDNAYLLIRELSRRSN